MKITQIREKEDAEALSVLDFDLLMEKIKTETKTRPVTGLRQALHFVLPGEPCSFAGKLPKIMPAAVFGRVNGVRRMKVYNGIVELTVGPLAGKVEVELVKKKAAELLLSGENLTVAEVSYKVGISDPFYFSKCFKTQFGVAPSVYQRGEMKEQGDNEAAEER